MSRHRRAPESSTVAPHVRRAGCYTLGLLLLAGGALGVGLAERQSDADPLAATRTAERASRGEARALPSQAAPPPTASPTPAPTTPAPTTAAPSTSAAKAVTAGCAGYSGNRLIACNLLPTYGYSTSQMSPLDKLWQRESGWRHTATNPSSGAYGIPQALPGSKMAGIAADWRTNPATQIRWGLSYIKGRYGSPANAWAHFQSHNWY